MLDIGLKKAILLFWGRISAGAESVGFLVVMIVVAPFRLSWLLLSLSGQRWRERKQAMLEPSRWEGLVGDNAYKVVCKFQTRHVG